MEWRDLGDEDVEGGALEVDFRFSLQVYKSRSGAEPVACWVSEDEEFVFPVELGRT